MDKHITKQAHIQRDITQIKQKIGNLEHTLHESYCDAGKTILEIAETESRKSTSWWTGSLSCAGN